MLDPQDITPLQAAKIKKRGEGVIIDVRELVEYNEVHIEDSIHIPLSEIQQKIHLLSELKCENIIMICRIGRRSHVAGQMAIEEGVSKKIYNMSGGITKWKQEGLSVVTHSNSVLSC